MRSATPRPTVRGHGRGATTRGHSVPPTSLAALNFGCWPVRRVPLALTPAVGSPALTWCSLLPPRGEFSPVSDLDELPELQGGGWTSGVTFSHPVAPSPLRLVPEVSVSPAACLPHLPSRFPALSRPPPPPPVAPEPSHLTLEHTRGLGRQPPPCAVENLRVTFFSSFLFFQMGTLPKFSGHRAEATLNAVSFQFSDVCCGVSTPVTPAVT